MTFEILSLSFTYAVCAFVWVAVLVVPGGFLDFLPPLLEKAPEKLMHVVFQCEKCLAGQLALWSFPAVVTLDYRVIDHILVVFGSIFVASFISKIYNRL